MTYTIHFDLASNFSTAVAIGSKTRRGYYEYIQLIRDTQNTDSQTVL